jgi:transcriptional regulator with XRE-family HTH domain
MDDEDRQLLRRVGRRIAELRAEGGETQEQFAERYGASVKYVQAVEGGRENLTLLTLRDVAATLEVDLEQLLVPPKSLVARRGRPPRK